MNYYIYVKDENGNEPLGSSNRVMYHNIRQYKKTAFFRECTKTNKRIVVQSFTNFLDQNTFRKVYET